MILFHLFRSGLWRRLDREKIRFFFGWTSPLFLSHSRSLASSFQWAKLLLDPRYAKAVVEWLSWRVDLFEGRRS